MKRIIVIVFALTVILYSDIQAQSGLTPLQKEKAYLLLLNNQIKKIDSVGQIEWNYNSDMIKLTTADDNRSVIFAHLSVTKDHGIYNSDIRSGIDNGELYYKMISKELFMVVRLKNNQIYFAFGSTPKDALKNLDSN